VLYGFVDHGPYENSWGGPSLAGAWLVHFLVSLPFAFAVTVALMGLVAVHQRLGVVLAGGRPAPWLIPVVLVMPLPVAVLFVAWLHQI
jgi:hypothetical protein